MQNHRPERSFRWTVIGMAFLGTAINYADRASLGVAEVSVRTSLGLSKSEMGLVLGAFFLAYAFFQLPAGWLVDRFGARLVYTLSCLWWSIFTSLTGIARGFYSLLAFRLLLGAGEAGAYPANAKATAEWFPPNERAFASSIFDSGSRLGTAIALPLVASVAVWFGWRKSFVVVGALGFVWSLAWYFIYRPPSDISPVPTSSRIPWLELVRYRAVIGMAAGFFCLSFVNYFYVTWFPTYLREGQGFSALQVGTVGMIPPLIATVGGWAGGFFSDRLLRRGFGLTVARKLPIVLGLLGSSVIFLSPLTHDLVWTMTWLSLSYACIAFAAAGVWALPGDVAPDSSYVGSLGGIQNFASNLAGVVLPPVVGYILDVTHDNFIIPLGLAGAVGVLGAGVYLFGMGPVAPLDSLNSAATPRNDPSSKRVTFPEP